MRGHGELRLRGLLDALRAGTIRPEAAGLCLPRSRRLARSPTNQIAADPPSGSPARFPYHRLDLGRYIRPTFLGKRTLPHHSSYGCPFFCNFCAVVNMVNGRWLAQSAERTATSSDRLVEEWRVDAVEFYDNNFFVHEARTADFAERIHGPWHLAGGARRASIRC